MNRTAPSRRLVVAAAGAIVLLIVLVVALRACARGDDVTSAAGGTTTSFGSGLVGGLEGPGIVSPEGTGSPGGPTDASLPDNVATVSTPTTITATTTETRLSPDEKAFCKVYIRVAPPAEAARSSGDPAQAAQVRAQFAGDETAFRQQAPEVIAADVSITADVYFTPNRPDDATATAAARNVGGWAFEHCGGVS